MAESSAKAHIAELDGIRAIAIGLVLFYHGFIGTQLGHGPIKYAHLVAGVGWTGVDLFFVLSGFLITRILLAAKGSDGYFRNFYARRTLRIFPLYYLFLVLMFVVLPLSGSSFFEYPKWLWLWLTLYGSNFYTALGEWPPESVGHLWSLAVEEQFYLLWPLVVAGLSRRSLAWFVLLLLLFSAGLRYFVAASGLNLSYNYVMLPTRLDTLAVGALLAVLANALDAAGMRRCLVVLAVAGVGLLGVCAKRVGYPTFTKTDPLHQALLYPGLALVYAAMVGWAFARSRDETLGGNLIVRWLKSGPMQLIGKVSYGIYVFHMPINMGMRHLGWHVQDSTVVGVAAFAWSLAYIAVLSVLSVATAWASWHLFEKRVLKLKRFFEYRAAPAPASEVR